VRIGNKVELMKEIFCSSKSNDGMKSVATADRRERKQFIQKKFLQGRMNGERGREEKKAPSTAEDFSSFRSVRCFQRNIRRYGVVPFLVPFAVDAFVLHAP